jgi:N-acetyl-gamma-glutamyl-phosphate reductase
MAYTTAVAGASGYTGAELLRLLAAHPAFDVTHVTAATNAGESIASIYPSLAPAYGDRRYEPLDPDALAGTDVVFCALPHGASQKFVPDIAGRVKHVIDLGADFRLPPDVYARWYGEAHAAPDWCGQFAYGMVELYRDALPVGTRYIASPGCYPTAVSLACAPFVAAGFVEPMIVANACSGVSGAGRGLKTTSLFSEANDSVSAYSLLTHRHTAEMEQALTHVAGSDVQVLFTPHLVPMTRGILATCYARPATSSLTTARLLDVARDYYADDPFVFVVDEPSATKATYGSNAVHLTARYDDRTGSVLAIAVLDNLVKGASGQMVQAANLALGLDETTGLSAIGIAP